MPEDYEEGIGLLKPNNNMPTSFVPDYSFSSNANLLNVTEATEMLEHTPQTTKETKETINKRPFRWKQWFTKNTVPEGTPRRIYVNKPEMNEQQHFMTNAVSTAKYNLFTFLPKFLYEEFSKSANIFFLFISGIQVLTLKKKKRESILGNTVVDMYYYYYYYYSKFPIFHLHQDTLHSSHLSLSC